MEQDLRYHTARVAEQWASTVLSSLGYDVHENGYHDHADLVINGQLRVEVKGSFWVSHKTRAGRYQWNTRQSPDVFILLCMGTQGHAFIIPNKAIGDRTNVAIWSHDPERYTGQWSTYLDDWTTIREELEQCQKSSAL